MASNIIDPAGDPTSDPTSEPTSEPTSDPTSDPAGNPAGGPAGDPMLLRRGGLIEAEVDGELVALHEENGTCYGFNGTATRIWALLAEPRRLSELRAALGAEYDVDAQVLAADVDELLDELEGDGLIERRATR